MSYLLDEVARTLAGPSSRRQTLRLLANIVAGGVLGSLGINRAEGQATANSPNHDRDNCGSQNCSRTQTCCTTGTRPFCITQGKRCCGNSSVGLNETCCSTASTPFVVTKGKTCCGSSSCGQGQECCTSSSRPFCASAGRTCCGTMACSKTEKCCGKVACCGEDQSCVNGKCSASRGG
jgi:hypothetical protein